jgi:hypothetical protein
MVTGNSIISTLKKKFRVSTDRDLAKKIGITIPGIQVWKNRQMITERQLSELVHKATVAGERNMQATAIRPLVEFFRIERTPSKQGAGYVLSAADGNRRYFEGLRSELESSRGVYIFFDSRGQAIYTGKARKQNLWKEMNLAYNRERGEIQKIKRVKHPRRNQTYRTSDEKSRQISDHVVPLYELAAYFSAYEVTDGMIAELEAMLVRSFANDLLNKRMERFRQQRTKTVRGKSSAAARKKDARATEASTPRADSKSAKILEMVGRAKGATLAEIMKATGWQAKSVHGFIWTVKRKHNLRIESTKTEAGDWVYRIKK